jgi:hypothetical protein
MWPAWPVWAEKTASLLAQALHNASFSQFNPNQNDFLKFLIRSLHQTVFLKQA